MTNTPHTLNSLQHELARTHRARLVRRRVIATGAVALPAIALAFTVLSHSVGGAGIQPVSPTLVDSTPAPPPSPLAGEGPAQRGVGGNSTTIQTMTDEELLAALAEAGQPSGLITINGHTTVVANRFPDAPSPFAPFRASINAAP